MAREGKEDYARYLDDKKMNCSTCSILKDSKLIIFN